MSDYTHIIKNIDPNWILFISMLCWIWFWVWRYIYHRSLYILPRRRIHNIKKYLYHALVCIAVITSILIPLDIKIPQDKLARVIDLSPSISENPVNISTIENTYRSAYWIWKQHDIILVTWLPYDYCEKCDKNALDDLTVDQTIFTGELYGSAMWDGLLLSYQKDKDMKIIGLSDSGTNKGISLSQAISYIWSGNVLILSYDDKSSIDKIMSWVKIWHINNLLRPIWIWSQLILLSLYILSIWKLKHSYDTL